MRWVVLLLAMLLVTPAANALDAATVRSMLHVDPGATCLSADTLAAEIPRWLPDALLATDVVIVVDGSQTDPQSAGIRLLRAGEVLARREFRPGPDGCAQLHSAVSLSIALALRASLVDEDRRAPPAPSSRHVRVALSAAGLAAYGLLSRLVAGPEARLELTVGRHFAVRAAGLGLLARGVPISGSRVRFDALFLGGRADACGRVRLAGPLHGQLCAGALGGSLHAWGRGDGDLRSAKLAWVALASALGLSVALSDAWSLGVEVGLIVPLRPIDIGSRDAANVVTAHESLGVAAGSLALSVSHRF